MNLFAKKIKPGQRLLVACEESQAVTKAFRAAGVEAYSNDLKECSGGHPEWHIQGDARDAVKSKYWHGLIAHPVCTMLANSGVQHLHTDIQRWFDLFEAARFFNFFLDCDIELKCVENPIPHGYAVELMRRGYDQIIHPWQHGHMEQKATCLWIEGFPLIEPTNNVYAEMMKLPDKERQRMWWLGGGHSEERSKTYPGIAAAMVKFFVEGQ